MPPRRCSRSRRSLRDAPERTGPFSGTRGRAVLTTVAFAATAIFPLLVEAAQRAGGRTDRAQDEVLVIEAGGERLWHTGTPYLGHDAIAALPPGHSSTPTCRTSRAWRCSACRAPSPVSRGGRMPGSGSPSR